MPRQLISIRKLKGIRAPLSTPWLRKVALMTLHSEGIRSAVELSLTLADEETMRQLNARYHESAEPTDVLSFPFSPDDTFVAPPGQRWSIGEVIISVPQAARQAQAAGHSTQREVALLTIHGILHLLGYDHAEPEEEQRMWQRQNALLQEMKL